MKRIVPVTLIAFGLVACTSSPKTASEFWYGQGERFGSRGNAIDNDSLADCKEKVEFDESAYLAAFEKGIKGTRYTDQCADMPQEVMIKAEWQRGWDAFIGADFYKFR